MKIVAFLTEGLGDGAGQEPRGAPPVHGAALRGFAVAILRQPADDRQLVPERLERLENRREPEAGPFGAWSPFLDDHAVRQIDNAEATDRNSRRPTERGERGNHSIEKRQGQARTEAAKNRATRQRSLGNDHDSDLRC